MEENVKLKIGDGSAKISLKVYINCNEGDLADFIAEISKLQKASLAESGCYEYTFYAHPQSKTKFFLYEEYADDEALAHHNISEHFNKFLKFLESKNGRITLDIKGYRNQALK